ncbi:DMT family transporter [Bacillus cereus]|uniref:DMT family transporter n=1 Tax=Bacillus cereus TaxID=1396 RepID=UPI002406C416|nr:DMT family transporter [Bacillus cereus]MDF9478965.1 DMT family transporter [Bacillus cereus]MDF9500544.1 DMT family transporter [Bacillus cereus]MDF9518464.1 DMT family transporter [Bacillus cereus]MDF9569685.1 DMT family transporter [Bacillus cereus]
MWYILALISSLAFGLGSFMMKVSSFKRGSTAHLLWGLYLSGMICFFVWVLVTDSWVLNLQVILAGLIIGFGTAMGNLLFMIALDHGPASLTSPVVNSNVIFTIGLSMLLYGEKLAFFEWIGVSLLVLAVLILPIDPDEKLRIRSLKWYMLVLAATFLFFLRNGGLKVTEELHLPSAMVLLISYFFAFLWFSIEIFRNKNSNLTIAVKRTGIYWGLGSGIFSFVGMQIYAIAVAKGPASIVAPIFSTNSLVVALLSIWIYRERISKLQTISLIILFLGLIFTRL